MERGYDSFNTVVGEKYAHALVSTPDILKGGALPVHALMPSFAVVSPCEAFDSLERVNTLLFQELLFPAVGGFSSACSPCLQHFLKPYQSRAARYCICLF
jgi:hypothetical protein